MFQLADHDVMALFMICSSRIQKPALPTGKNIIFIMPMPDSPLFYQ